MTNPIFFINLKNNKYSRTKSYYHGLVRLSYNCSWREVASFKDWVKVFREIRSSNLKPIIIGTSRSQIISVYSFFMGHRIILDAGLPLWDGVITSRREFGFLCTNMMKVYLIDFFSFHLAKRVIFETEVQVSRVSKMFFLNKNKISYLLLGLDEGRFQLKKLSSTNKFLEKNVIKILFRGGNQIESGIPLLLEAIYRLRHDARFEFTLISNNLNFAFESNNLKLFTGHLSDAFIQKSIEESDLVLGQMLNHKRLKIAIPHKFYEAAFFSKPYLTADYGLMSTFQKKGLVFGFKAGDITSFIEQLKFLYDNQGELHSSGLKLGSWYGLNSSQFILSGKFYSIILKELSKKWRPGESNP